MRHWYVKASIEHGWSRNVLEFQIDACAHERQGKAITNFEATLPPSDSDLIHEYQHLVKDFGFTRDELERVSLNGIQASFLSQDEKQKLTGEFQAEFNQIAKG